MGGDGGVIASNRRYMRGAGTADHTGDEKYNSSGTTKGQNNTTGDALERIRTCAITKSPFVFSSSATATTGGGGSIIVACPYGRLYHKEAAIESLLRSHRTELGDHVRGLKDLFNVRFHTITTKNKRNHNNNNATTTTTSPACPVTGVEFNGHIPAILLVQIGSSSSNSTENNNNNTPNVLSSSAIKEMNMESLQEEYGPFNYQIKLVPTTIHEIENMEIKWNEYLQKEKELKKKNKKRKKQQQRTKHNDDDATKLQSLLVVKQDKDDDCNHNKKEKNKQKEEKRILKRHKKQRQQQQQRGNSTTNTETTTLLTDAVRQRVASAVQKNQVLSSIFTKT